MRGGTCTLLVVLFACIDRQLLVDDALIYHRYLRNAVEGNGLVYNVGERFNALTSPLFTYLSLGLASVWRDIERNQTFLSAAALVVACLGVLRLFWQEEMRLAGLSAALLLACGPFYYSTFGMESTLFVALLVWTLPMLRDPRPVPLGLCVGLIVLTRPDAFVLALVCAAFVAWRRRWHDLAMGSAVFLLCGLPTALFNLLYYGQVLPHTFAAKTAQGTSGLFGDGILVLESGYIFQELFGAQRWILLIPVAVAATALPWLKRSVVMLALALFVLLQTAFLALVRVPPYHWYYAAHFLALWLLFAWGSEVLTRRLSVRTGSPWPWRIQVGLLALVLALNLVHGVQRLSHRGRYESYRRAGAWIRDHTPPDASLACIEIGHIGWSSERPIIDVLGLVNFHNAEGLGRGEPGAWTEYYEPDLLLAHSPPWTRERSLARLATSGEYEKVAGFPEDSLGLQLWRRIAE